MAEAWRFDELVGRINDRAQRLGKFLQDDARNPGRWFQSDQEVQQPSSEAEMTQARAMIEEKIRAGLAKAGQKVKKKR
ncbi:MAG TPA: hypothetical protein DHV49_07680 [Alphaproteobacteria bacterium]|nr:hypothetical protein [Alphaproteobacteria bacterium]|tara:strand:- start:649 stop:882 length:234 start_codon:yes stop_codon:yes gene_type:complete